jgi:hypothetical protein
MFRGSQAIYPAEHVSELTKYLQPSSRVVGCRQLFGKYLKLLRER